MKNLLIKNKDNIASLAICIVILSFCVTLGYFLGTGIWEQFGQAYPKWLLQSAGIVAGISVAYSKIFKGKGE